MEQEEKIEKVTDVSAAGRARIAKQKGKFILLWLLVPVAFFVELSFMPWGDDNAIGSVLYILVVIGLMGAEFSKARQDFWKSFAQEHRWTYKESGDPGTEKGFLFNMSASHSHSIGHTVEAMLDGRKLRIFE